jgi:hypothetical protein
MVYWSGLRSTDVPLLAFESNSSDADHGTVTAGKGASFGLTLAGFAFRFASA